MLWIFVFQVVEDDQPIVMNDRRQVLFLQVGVGTYTRTSSKNLVPGAPYRFALSPSILRSGRILVSE